MECPKCKSDNTQRLEVIYENGTQDINTTSRTVGGGYGGGVGAGGATTRTTGQAQSKQAQKAAPPKQASFGLSVGLVIVSIFLFVFGVWYIALIGFGLAFVFGKKPYEYNKNVHPAKYREWQNKWMCHKCGEIYTMS
jgi:hypothetical protein